ncbi:hypothetical protein J2X68_007682 [Streptomyces sp. 3330]|uniref:hypothetical protein n=1 Tax=Streptomyces sp. 3330 TaxID=2817755 RepID=UPI002862410C|nr:hypothetical protein [Streptomyces sp. 3330]MDR6980940.1 hypothetical protein [Streptomyces sp. 3330]
MLGQKVNEANISRDLKKFMIYTEAIKLAREHPAAELSRMLENQRQKIQAAAEELQRHVGAARTLAGIPGNVKWPTRPSFAPSQDELNSASAMRLMDPKVAGNQRVSANNGKGEPYLGTARPSDSYLEVSASYSGGPEISNYGLADIAGMRVSAPSSAHLSELSNSSTHSVVANPQLAAGTQLKRR